MYNSYYEKILATGEVKCIDEEIPFEIPERWEWVRLNELGIYRKGPFGSSLTKFMFVPKSATTIKVYEQKNAIQKDYTLGEYYITQEKFQSMLSFIVKPLDIIVSCAGTIGESYVLPEDAPIGIINQALMRISLFKMDICDYYLLYFDYTLKRQAQLLSSGSAIKNIPPFEILKNMLMPIPPLAEQKRILGRTDEIINAISKYELLKETLDKLDTDLQPQLKKSILQYAIQGKLVEQCDTDEPATELLKRIHEEKLNLVKQGKLKKKDVSESTIFSSDDNRYYEKVGSIVNDITDEIPYELPTGWQWVRMKNCCIRIFSGKSPKYSKIPTNHLIIGQQANQWDGVKMQYAKYGTDEFVQKIEDYQYLIDGDVLLNTLGNGTLGRCGIFENISNKVLTDGHLFVFRTDNKLLARYLLFFLTVNYAEINKKADGSTNQTFLNLSKMSNYLIPIPPANEVKRIIEKIHILQKSIEGL